jgi:DUF4097 and DUF4098 domain-containing protein YvlB
MERNTHAATLIVVVTLVGVVFAGAETRKELRFNVGKKASLSVTNGYGPISVKPSNGKQIVIVVTTYSDKVEIDQAQRGSRVEVLSHLLPGADADSGRVNYDVAVPPDAAVMLHSTSGGLRIEKLHGDVTVEQSMGDVDVRDFRDAHLHIKTLDGEVVLNNIRDGHVEISSVGGNVVLNSVNGPYLQVNSTSGNIQYDGDFGFAGEYLLMSHTGNIEAVAPAYASIDVTARSVNGQVVNDFTLEPEHVPFMAKAGSAFAGTINKAASRVKLLSFSGKIHLKKR